MYVPVRTVNYEKTMGTVATVPCPHCRQNADFTKLQLKCRVTVMFLPIFWTTLNALLKCQRCGATFAVGNKSMRTIVSAQDALQEICRFTQEQDLAARQQTEKKKSMAQDRREQGFSDKSQVLAVILAIGFTTFGAPFFYIGKPAIGILFLVLSFAAMALLAFPLLALIVLIGFVLASFLGMGKVRDQHGKYIMSKKQRQFFEDR